MVQIAHLHGGHSRLGSPVISLGGSQGWTIHAALRAILLRITLIDVSLWVLANITFAVLTAIRRRLVGSQ
jgi:hypothetical protein